MGVQMLNEHCQREPALIKQIVQQLSDLRFALGA
jgi:hypothetical protein